MEDLHASGHPSDFGPLRLWFRRERIMYHAAQQQFQRQLERIRSSEKPRRGRWWTFAGHVGKPHCSQAAMFVDYETTSEYLNVDLNLVWSTLPHGHRRLPMYSNVEIFHELNTSWAARSWAMNFLGHSLDWVHVPGFQTQKQYTPKQSLICYHKKYM